MDIENMSIKELENLKLEVDRLINNKNDMSEKFNCFYSFVDGYGRNANKRFIISEEDLYDDMSVMNLRHLFVERMENDSQWYFERDVYPIGMNMEEFIEWAVEKIALKCLESRDYHDDTDIQDYEF